MSNGGAKENRARGPTEKKKKKKENGGARMENRGAQIIFIIILGLSPNWMRVRFSRNMGVQGKKGFFDRVCLSPKKVGCGSESRGSAAEEKGGALQKRAGGAEEIFCSCFFTWPSTGPGRK